jgi:hypothetical protein
MNLRRPENPPAPDPPHRCLADYGMGKCISLKETVHLAAKERKEHKESRLLKK